MSLTRQGQNVPLDLRGMGIGIQDEATIANTAYTSTDTGAGVVVAEGNTKPAVYALIAVIAFLVIAKVISEHNRFGESTHLLSIGVWNWVIGGTMTAAFLVVAKTIVNKYNVGSGIRTFFNAV